MVSLQVIARASFTVGRYVHNYVENLVRPSIDCLESLNWLVAMFVVRQHTLVLKIGIP